MGWKKHLIMGLILVLLMGIQSRTFAAQPNIRVGLWTQQTNVTVSANEVFEIRDPGTNDRFGKFTTGTRVLITQKNNRLYVNDLPVKSIVLSVQAIDENGRVEVNNKAYRGKILIKKMDNGMTVINDLPLEQYLYSVVPEEMPSSWPIEALKAQAVAARSYAIYSMNRHEAEGYDVCALTHCQVYGGSNVENEIAAKAVDATRGQVLLYDHKPIFAAFHASSGGSTENSEDVWGTFIPYLRSVTDYDQNSPDYHWMVQFTPADLSQLLSQYGYNIGTLQSITLSDFNSGQSDRSVGGAVKEVVFSGSQNTVELTGSKVRSILGLKSTKFAIGVFVPLPKKIDVAIARNSGYNKSIDVNLPDYQVPKMMTGSKNIHLITDSNEEIIKVEGYGSGHRVGMSQWGAKALAEQGYDYQSILYTYYTEVSIGNWY
ncbi:SpoIID/LytB domain-containing protein [Pectinatus frisingensis]|jgi:stage II sporulation protein D|uniref:SpoIID/LytB domain-containing protein n=1 Tax=Pectinatus frisingensis TaxID=865 RepID=UPI0018C4B3A9|nr:SpoIID/LytB domain-containing protein [Pectinatus frisingensis]